MTIRVQFNYYLVRAGRELAQTFVDLLIYNLLGRKLCWLQSTFGFLRTLTSLTSFSSLPAVYHRVTCN